MRNTSAHPLNAGSHTPPAGLTLQTRPDRKSTRLNSSHLVISYAVFCLKKKTTDTTVWLLDAPGSVALDALTAHRYSDTPPAAVILSDDACQPTQLARSSMRD